MGDAGTTSPSWGLTRRERWAATALFAAALALVGVLIALLWQPAPPRVVVMSTGPADGAYHAYAMQYQRRLARAGVRLVLEPSSGAVENLARLRTRALGVEVALVQGGVARAEAAHAPGSAGAENTAGAARAEIELMSLGGMFHEALWVFHRQDATVSRLGDFSARRVAAGAPGSGTRRVVQALFSPTHFSGTPPQLLDLGGLAAAQALQQGGVDAALFVASPESPAVQQLLRAKGVRLLSFARADAYTRRFAHLTKLTLPEGAADLALNLPQQDVTLLAATASLVATAELHPAIVELLLGAAREIHGAGSLLWPSGQFPSPYAAEHVLSPDAERFLKNGPSPLQRYLPFWAVAWIQRLFFVGLPVLAVGLPLLRYVPALYRWGMRRRIYRWYGELSFIERTTGGAATDQATPLDRLAAIEQRIGKMRIPPAFAAEAYALKLHLQWVRARLRGSA
jgi:TRAP-type uncharacterized transport system substrate-binding protein